MAVALGTDAGIFVWLPVRGTMPESIRAEVLSHSFYAPLGATQS